MRFALRRFPWENPYCLPQYEDRILLLNLQSLLSRRKISDIVFLYQIIVGRLDTPSLLCSVEFNTHFLRFRHQEFLNVGFHRTNYGLSEPMTRMCRSLNDATDCVDFNFDKEKLKIHLRSFNFT